MYAVGTRRFQRQVLVVDDAIETKVRLAQWLTQNSYHSIFVCLDQTAEGMLKHHRFDMIVHSREFPFRRLTSSDSESKGG